MNNGVVAALALATGTAAALCAGQAVSADERSMEDRLRMLEDHIQIEQLLMRYAAALNTKDADAYVAMFTPDAVFELRRHMKEPPFLGPFKGREALRKQWFAEGSSPGGAQGFGPMRHVTTNYEINVKGSTATVRAFFIEVVSNGNNSPPGSKPPTIHAMGRYEDELVKQDGQWLFSKRIVVTDMNTKWEP
jgi:ketosteroid isomerase-like protein